MQMLVTPKFNTLKVMLINHRYKFIFVHIPKTGGAAFRSYNREHLSRRWWRQYKEIGAAHSPLTRTVSDEYPDYFKFTIVRNSWKLIASAYRFDTQGVRTDRNGKICHREISLHDWLLEQSTRTKYGPFPNQLGYVSDDAGLLVDYLCHQETLAEDMRHVLQTIGAEYDESAWTSPKRHYHGNYDWKNFFDDPATRNLVYQLCKEDIEYFGWPLQVG